MSAHEQKSGWHFWPVLCLAIMYPINSVMVSLAIPLFFFRQGVQIEMIGLMVAAQACAYCFSPLLFNKLSDRIGRKRSITIAMSGICLAQCTYYITLNPYIFLIERFVEGIALGFFWPNMQSSISDNAQHDHSRLMVRYNSSWNIGCFIGFSLGAGLLYFVDNLLIIFYLGPIIMLFNVFIAVKFFQESHKTKLTGVPETDTNSNNYSHEMGYAIPVIVPILIMVFFGFAKGSVNFIYPIKSEILRFETYTVYLFLMLGIVAQTISAPLGSSLSIKILRKLLPFMMIGMIASVVFLGAFQDFYMLLIAYILIGFFGGFIIGSASKLFVLLNVIHNTSRYSSISETFIGIVFFISPVISGFIVAGTNIDFTFYIISIILSIEMIFVFVLLRKLKLII